MAGVEVEPRKGDTRQATQEKHGVANPPPPVAMVTFPDAARRRAQSFPPPLKLECEDSTEDMNPRNLWQVYALGGFMISKWIWARWRERNNRGTSDEDSST
uniref:Uncharacterized protein n=1 Tax=Musa acuminata subsp. malaccensis TaxID=214687 RepID=A0A804JHP8_MUSAM|nr:PREDICTED: uncharacterized protein LOC103988035 [Musa acuminata subsp. malaccensis]